MKSSYRAPALLQPFRGSACPAYGMSRLSTTFFLSFFLCFLGCGCSRLEEVPSIRDTLYADNVCVKDQVLQEGHNHYKLDVGTCYARNVSYLSVQVRVTETNDSDPNWALLVNNQGLVPLYDPQEWTTNGSVAAYIDADHAKPYALLNLTLGPDQESSPAIYASVYSTKGPLKFVIKTWCSETDGCIPSCSDPDTGPCVSVDTCRCTREITDATCNVAEEVLAGSVQGRMEVIVHDQVSLSHGEWKFFKFKVEEPESRILVEMSRAYGDVVLYLKPKGDGEFPIEIDFYEYADVESFQNRLSHHHIYTVGSGYYFVGVYNSDACVLEETYFNLSVSIAPQELRSVTLCPLNCSYPNGNCVSDMNCQCEPGYGGDFCQGSLWPAKPRRSFTGLLHPGDWAYFSVLNSDVPNSKNLSVSFRHTGGHPILLAKQDGYPTLTDNHLKFTDSALRATASDVYEIDTDSLADGKVILALFNVDYPVQGDLQFEILIIGGRKGLKVWIILLVAICSSLVVLGVIIFARQYMKCGGDRTGDFPLDFEATQASEVGLETFGLDRGVVSTYPLLSYREGLLHKEDARCPICLVDYNVPQLLRRIPVCRHLFHVNCIDEWFLSHSSCPICRITLQRSPSVSATFSQL